MKNNLLFCALLFFGFAQAQTTADFENFGLMPGEFINQTEDDLFTTGNISLPNFYFEDYDYWDGWAISATTDTMTRGFLNQYSSRSGAGYNGSSSYALTYAFFEQPINLTGDAAGAPVNGLYVNNGTYAYFSMLEGDGVGKKFGGETGDDPDFFLLTIEGELDGVRKDDVVEFYLADFRFEDNSEDYIVADWTFIDLQVLGNVDRLFFSLTSSDVGENGMNTPAYIFVDNIITADQPLSTVDQRVNYDLSLFPNPATSFVQLSWNSNDEANANLFNAQGQLVLSQILQQGSNTIAVEGFPAGSYFLRIESENGWDVRKIMIK